MPSKPTLLTRRERRYLIMNGKAKEVLSGTGKQFYSWGTIASFAGAAGGVRLIWAGLKTLPSNFFDSNIMALIVSFSVMIVLAFFTEPPKGIKTTWRDKGQKAFQTILNSFLVYFAVLGIPVR